MANENSDVVSPQEPQQNNEQAVPAIPRPVAPAPAPVVEAAATETPEVESPAEDGGEAPVPVPVRPRSSGSGAAGEQFHGLGRRKSSVARVLIRPGEGAWTVNGRTLEDYFPRAILRQSIEMPFAATETHGSFDVKVSVRGGGLRGQADAVRLGLARALLAADEDYRGQLRAEALLTRDPREVERKKPGRPKARKRFQFSKR